MPPFVEKKPMNGTENLYLSSENCESVAGRTSFHL
jgi:hypothetical protein